MRTVVEARWSGAVIASSDDTVVVEGNHYFPRESVNAEFLEGSDKTTSCPWKGTAHYYTLRVDGAYNRDAAWYYLDSKPKAAAIQDHIAFWRGVTVS